MLHHQNGMIRRAECFFFGFRQRLEGMGDQSHRKPAALLELDRVVDTPRRARTSIAETADDEIRLRGQFIKIGLGRPLLRG